MKTLIINDIKIKLIVERDDMIAVRGNAIASGDDAYDKEVEDGIIERLNSGDVWAWAQVEVKCTYKDILTASDYLGACCYANEKEFKEGGYYDDMVNACLNELNEQIKTICEA